VTFDFGNTLVPVDRTGLDRVVDRTARAIVERCGPFGLDSFLVAWSEERERQFAEDVPAFREVDLSQRVVRVLARLRGMAVPDRRERWDDEAAAGRSTPAELEFAIDVYSRAFVEAIPPPAGTEQLLARLARHWRLAIVSNWPLAATIDRYAEAAGWAPHLAAIVISQRIGTIKPHPAMFRAAEDAIGESGRAILHVGDDWAADIVGAKQAGWRAAYLVTRPADSPLPASSRDERVEADLEVSSLAELEATLLPADPGP
jgi:HAD superfamily hydrolase (TIGR01509 family)